MVTFEPTSALTSVDLPTLGAPISATKPQRVAAGEPVLLALSVIAAAGNAFTLDHDGGCDFFRSALAAADAFGRIKPGKIHGHPKLRIVVRAGTLYLAVNGRRETLALRPFLQHRLGIAQRSPRLAHPLRPIALAELPRGSVAAIEKDRTDYRLADVAEHRLAQPGPRPRSYRAKLDIIEQAQRLGDISAAFLPYEIGEALREFALIGAGKSTIEHVRYYQPEHMIAEEFETLVTVATLARSFQRRNMSKGGYQQIGIHEFVT